MSASRSPYPAPMMREARDLHSAGWTPGQIRALFARRGLDRVPTEYTIRLWTHPDYRQAQHRSHRRWQARATADRGRFRLHSDSVEYLAAFARKLRDEGVPRSAIARVLTVVTGSRWSTDRVKALLSEPDPPEIGGCSAAAIA
jgi:FAD/FMN-containing dehydrogenase